MYTKKYIGKVKRKRLQNNGLKLRTESMHKIPNIDKSFIAL